MVDLAMCAEFHHEQTGHYMGIETGILLYLKYIHTGVLLIDYLFKRERKRQYQTDNGVDRY